MQLKRQTKIKGNNEVPVDLKSYWASRKSDCTILQTIQSGGWFFAIRNCDHKRHFCYRFIPFLVELLTIFLALFFSVVMDLEI